MTKTLHCPHSHRSKYVVVYMALIFKLIFQESEHSFELFVHDEKNYEATDTNIETSPAFPTSFSNTKLYQIEAVEDVSNEDGCQNDEVDEPSVKLRQRKVRIKIKAFFKNIIINLSYVKLLQYTVKKVKVWSKFENYWRLFS